MKVQDFQAKINQSIVLAKRLMEEKELTGDTHIEIGKAVFLYLRDNGIHARGKDLLEIKQRGALLRKGNDTVLFLSGIVVGASGFGMTITSIE